MDSVLVVVASVSVVLASLSYLLLRRLTEPGVGQEDIQRIEGFSVATYGPMARLLLEEDAEFLRSQPGYEPGLERKLRKQRVMIFRAYLRSLGKDFSALHRAARTLVAHAPDDQPELASQIFRQGLLFWSGMAMVHVNLVLYAWNLSSTVVRVQNLVEATRRMQSQMFVPSAVSASN